MANLAVTVSRVAGKFFFRGKGGVSPKSSSQATGFGVHSAGVLPAPHGALVKADAKRGLQGMLLALSAVPSGAALREPRGETGKVRDRPLATWRRQVKAQSAVGLAGEQLLVGHAF